MRGMWVDDLPDADRLWWRFAVLAALDRAVGGTTWSFDPRHHMLRYDAADGARLRMQRLYTRRSVLWGNAAGERTPRAWTGVPGWATSDAVLHWLHETGASALAWWSRGEWDTATPEQEVGPMLAPLLGAEVPHDLVQQASRQQVTAGRLHDLLGPRAEASAALDLLRRAAGETSAAQGQVGRFLEAEVHQQMRAARERDRVLPQRPVPLVRWSRVADLPGTFTFVVRCEFGRLVADIGNDYVGEQHTSALLNVLGTLLHDEATDDGGAWLFARVRRVAGRLEYDRAFDGWPEWYDGPGPSLRALAWEMSQRSAPWRPPWSRLLPTAVQGRRAATSGSPGR